MTETTEIKRNWIFYDGNCPVCRNTKKHFERVFEKRGIRWAPLQAPWVRYRTGIPVEELYREMKILDGDGKVRGGIDAWLYLAGRVWWMYPFHLFGKIPFLYGWLKKFYIWVAANRYCAGGTCPLKGN